MTERPKRGRPPKPDGPTPGRHIRIGPIWDEAHTAATEDREKFSAFVERALRLELQRRRRRIERERGRDEA
jgi:hypothetical protein